MKLLTKNKEISCLKVLLAAEFAKIPVALTVDSHIDKPLLVINEDVQYFSLNTAAWYISSLKGSRKFSAEIAAWMEWEATVLSLENGPIDPKLTLIENNLTKAFITGVSVYFQRHA